MAIRTYFLDHIHEVAILVAFHLTILSYLWNSAVLLFVALLETGYMKVHRFWSLSWVLVQASISTSFFIYFLELSLFWERFVSLWLNHRQRMILFYSICWLFSSSLAVRLLLWFSICINLSFWYSHHDVFITFLYLLSLVYQLFDLFFYFFADGMN